MWTLFHWILGYWSVLIWLIPITIACAATWYFLGRRFSVPVGVLGTMLIIFLMGRKSERDNYRKHVQDIKEKREQAYEKIDSRHTDRNDVLDRLSDGNF